MPAIIPINIAPCGPISKLHTEPTATPPKISRISNKMLQCFFIFFFYLPASVEFCMCTMSSLFSWLTIADTTNVVTVIGMK